ncbi:MAG: hypothetical protein AB8B55_23525 [Mariniblastus sp.]
MKQELPFAIVLLAVGSFLWLSQREPDDEAINAKESIALAVEKAAFGDEHAQQASSDLASKNANTRTAGADSAITGQSQVQQAWYGDAKPKIKNPDETLTAQAVVTAGYIEAGEQSASSAVSQEAAVYVHAVSNIDSVKFLAEVSKQLAGSPSFGASLILTGNLFEQTVTANGRYFQMGQGSGKSRIDLRFGETDDSPTVFQLCDGRFVYNLQTSGPSSIPTFEFVDLMRVRETSGEQSQQISPTGWVATGGISSLFQHLASAFNFGEMETNGVDQILLRGSWDENALRRIVTTGNDIDLGTPIHWEKVPGQLPHAVEIVFEKYDQFGYFPKRISFQKFSIQEERVVMKPTVKLRLDSPKSLPELNDRFFVIDSSNLESVDATDNYIERIQLFRALPFRPQPTNETQKAEAKGAKIR